MFLPTTIYAVVVVMQLSLVKVEVPRCDRSSRSISQSRTASEHCRRSSGRTDLASSFVGPSIAALESAAATPLYRPSPPSASLLFLLLVVLGVQVTATQSLLPLVHFEAVQKHCTSRVNTLLDR
jgi:hypothetical protein